MFQVPKGMLQTLQHDIDTSPSSPAQFQVPKGMLQTIVSVETLKHLISSFKSPRECYKQEGFYVGR